jgi:hypothetical protein
MAVVIEQNPRPVPKERLPASLARRARANPRVRLLLLALWVPVSAVVQLQRGQKTPIWDVIWAEDGKFFYGEARSRGFSATLFEPLANYLQVVPRFLVGVAAQLPTSRAALAISVLAALTASLLSVYVFVATAGVVGHLWQRLLLAALVVLHPAAGFEVVADLNNVHWYLMFAAFWAMLSVDERPRRIVAAVVVVVLAALSDPLTGLLLPVAALRAWRGSRSARWTTGGLLVGLGLQYLLAVSRGVPTQYSHAAPLDLPIVYGFRVAGSFLFGDQAIRGWWDADGRWFAVLALLTVAAGFALAIVVSRPRERRLIAMALVYSVVFLVMPFLVRGGASGLLRHPTSLNGSRYTIIPLWFLYSALIVAAGATLPAGLPPLARRALIPSLCGLLLGVQLVLNFAPSGPRGAGPSWSGAVQAAEVECSRGALNRPISSTLPSFTRPRLVQPGVVAIPVPPWGKSWAVTLRCSSL